MACLVYMLKDMIYFVIFLFRHIVCRLIIYELIYFHLQLNEIIQVLLHRRLFIYLGGLLFEILFVFDYIVLLIFYDITELVIFELNFLHNFDKLQNIINILIIILVLHMFFQLILKLQELFRYLPYILLIDCIYVI